MVISKALLLALAAAQCSATLTRRNTNVTVDGDIIPGAYVVQFEEGHGSTDSFYQNLTASGIGSIHRQSFSADVFAGTSFHLDSTDKTDLDTISSFAQVKSIGPVRLFRLTAPTNLENVNWQKVKAKRSLNTRDVGTVTLKNDTLPPHVMTGVDKLHAEGFDGSAIKVAIVDTGIDYTLPALGGGFGPGHKVAFGYDLVGDNYYGTNTPVPDADPMDCEGHGTHVAGIVGASNDPYVLGVAPAATLGIYKVFGCYDTVVASDVLISAFTMAYNDGADLISASIGYANGWPEEPWAAVVGAIVEAGVPCVLAAGNDGDSGIFYSSSAAAGNGVTAVGSVENTFLPETLLRASYSSGGDETNFGFRLAIGDFGNTSLPIWVDTYDTTIVDDGCNGITANLTGKIAVIRRGTCTFDTKVQAAYGAGALYVIFYNNVPGTADILVDNIFINAAGIVSPETGAAWISLLEAGKEVVLTFNDNNPLLVTTPGTQSNATGGFMNVFSTWGPSNENTIKPVISAPGGDILSTYLSSAGGYTVMSGTSMATPFIAGVLALYMQSQGHKRVDPVVINSALASSATPLNYFDGTTSYDYLASIAQQGAGLVNAYNMIHSTISVSVPNIALNDTANFVKDAHFDLKNIGSGSVTYTLTHEPASNVYSFDAGDFNAVSSSPEIDTQYSAVVLSPSTVTLKGNQKQRIGVDVKPAAGLDTTRIPVYSGYIKITSSTGEVARVPYAGVAGTMNDIAMIRPGSNFFSYYSSNSVTYENQTINSFTPASLPTYYFGNSWATPLVRLDIVGVNVTNTLNVSGLEMMGSVPGFPLPWLVRELDGYSNGGAFNGTLADGTTIPSGVYKFVMRLLKPFGSLEEGGYERYDSKYFYMDMD